MTTNDVRERTALNGDQERQEEERRQREEKSTETPVLVHKTGMEISQEEEGKKSLSRPAARIWDLSFLHDDFNAHPAMPEIPDGADPCQYILGIVTELIPRNRSQDLTIYRFSNWQQSHNLWVIVSNFVVPVRGLSRFIWLSASSLFYQHLHFQFQPRFHNGQTKANNAASQRTLGFREHEWPQHGQRCTQISA